MMNKEELTVFTKQLGDMPNMDDLVEILRMRFYMKRWMSEHHKKVKLPSLVVMADACHVTKSQMKACWKCCRGLDGEFSESNIMMKIWGSGRPINVAAAEVDQFEWLVLPNTLMR
jgi:hypothetical protein